MYSQVTTEIVRGTAPPFDFSMEGDYPDNPSIVPPHLHIRKEIFPIITTRSLTRSY